MFSACPTSFAKKKQKQNFNDGESCLVLENQFALFETFAFAFVCQPSLWKTDQKQTYSHHSPQKLEISYLLCVFVFVFVFVFVYQDASIMKGKPLKTQQFLCQYVTECDIRENFHTNECPNIFVSTKLHE